MSLNDVLKRMRSIDSGARFTINAGLNWQTHANSVYGIAQTNVVSGYGGTGDYPEPSWFMFSWPVNAGERVTRLLVNGRKSNAEPEELEFSLVLRTATGTAITASTNQTITQIVNGLFFDPGDGQTAVTPGGTSGKMIRRNYDCDFTIPKDGDLFFAVRAINRVNAQEWRGSYSILLESGHGV